MPHTFKQISKEKIKNKKKIYILSPKALAHEKCFSEVIGIILNTDIVQCKHIYLHIIFNRK